MKSPARHHYLRHQAAAHAASADTGDSLASASAYELMLAKLAEDRRRLKGIQSIEGKAKLKYDLLPDYAPWIQGVLENGRGSQDDVLMTVMIWFLDAGIWRGALEIAEYALAYKLIMPDQYQRTVATAVAEEIAEQAIKQLFIVNHPPIDVGALLHVERLVADQDMPDEVRAKLHKAIGFALRESPDFEEKQKALEHLQRALQLSQKAGVKKDIERLERELKATEKANVSTT